MLHVKPYLVLVLAVLFAAPALAQKEALPSESDLAAISGRGRLLYEYDQAAWHSSDAVMAAKPEKAKLGRYIARKTDAGWVVAFGRLNENRDGFPIAALATQGKTPQEYSVQKLDPVQVDTAFFFHAAKAIETALRDFQGPQRPYNAAVLPAPEDKFFVYVVPAQTEEGVYPLGADARYLISADGATIVEKRQLHKGIVARGSVPPGTTVVGGSHSHVLSDVPEDTDVFFVLTRKPPMPEYIATQVAVYAVNPDGSIEAVERTKKRR
jgi:hypothetical protein